MGVSLYVREIQSLLDACLYHLGARKKVQADWQGHVAEADRTIGIDRPVAASGRFNEALREQARAQSEIFDCIEAFLAAWARLSSLFSAVPHRSAPTLAPVNATAPTLPFHHYRSRAMDDGALDARIVACERQIARLRRTLGLAGLALGLLGAVVLSGFTGPVAPTMVAPLDSLRVGQLIVVDTSGTVRVRVGADLPDAVLRGRRLPRGDVAAGVLLYDHTGMERGGYVTFNTSGSVALTLDSRERQVALFSAGPAPDDGAAIRVWRQQDWAELKVDGGGPHVSVGRDGALAFMQPEPTAGEAAAMCTELKAEVAQVTPPPSTAVVLAACKAHASDGVCRRCLGLP